jgi:nitrite reductase/ring-hydroxylating ferredoxin subunit
MLKESISGTLIGGPHCAEPRPGPQFGLSQGSVRRPRNQLPRTRAPLRKGSPALEVSMPEIFVAKRAQFPDGERRIVSDGTQEIGVFHWQGKFYAYENRCLHQGGPACEGLTIAKVEERIMPDKTSRGLYFSDTELHFVCPWHGMEYDMKTGECVSDRKMKLKKYKVVQKGEDIYVVA